VKLRFLHSEMRLRKEEMRILMENVKLHHNELCSFILEVDLHTTETNFRH
jgi:hypothetical protein